MEINHATQWPHDICGGNPSRLGAKNGSRPRAWERGREPVLPLSPYAYLWAWNGAARYSGGEKMESTAFELFGGQAGALEVPLERARCISHPC
jgi:hypothetical protein